MAIPTRILGVTWGPLLAMSVLNAAWILLAAWAVRRRLGDRAAMGALVFMGAAMWTFGNSLFHSPVPMAVVIPPFIASVFIAWAVAAGDGGVLWLLALVANFVLLDHLVLTIVAPPIVIAALVCWSIGVLRTRGQRAATWDLVRRRALRDLLGAALVTLVLWLPVLIQQLTTSPGNLTNLWRANAASPPVTAEWARAWAVLISMFTEPPFWLHGSRSRNLLQYGPAPSPTAQILGTVVLVGLLVTVGVYAVRRRDRAALSAGVLGGVTLVASWYNLAHPRNPTALPNMIGYFLSTWVVAMFVTFAVVYGLVRMMPPRVRVAAPPVALAGVVALFVLNVPHTNITVGTYEAPDAMIAAAGSLDTDLVDALGTAGRIRFGRTNMYTGPVSSSAAVALVDAGVPICVDGTPQWTEIPVPRCDRFGADLTIEFHQTTTFDGPASDQTVIATYDPLDAVEHQNLAELDHRLAAALDTDPVTTLSPAYRRRLAAIFPDGPVLDQALHPEYLDDPLASPRADAGSRT